jgi:hypothetical protein
LDDDISLGDNMDLIDDELLAFTEGSPSRVEPLDKAADNEIGIFDDVLRVGKARLPVVETTMSFLEYILSFTTVDCFLSLLLR